MTKMVCVNSTHFLIWFLNKLLHQESMLLLVTVTHLHLVIKNIPSLRALIIQNKIYTTLFENNTSLLSQHHQNE